MIFSQINRNFAFIRIVESWITFEKKDIQELCNPECNGLPGDIRLIIINKIRIL